MSLGDLCPNSVESRNPSPFHWINPRLNQSISRDVCGMLLLHHWMQYFSKVFFCRPAFPVIVDLKSFFSVFPILTRFDPYWPDLTCFDPFKTRLTRLDQFGPVWPVLTCFDQCYPFRPILSCLDPYWTSLNCIFFPFFTPVDQLLLVLVMLSAQFEIFNVSRMPNFF